MQRYIQRIAPRISARMLAAPASVVTSRVQQAGGEAPPRLQIEPIFKKLFTNDFSVVDCARKNKLSKKKQQAEQAADAS